MLGFRLSALSALVLLLATASTAHAQFILSDYQLTSTISLVLPGNTEASGVTFNRDNGRLYVVEDEGLTLYELNTSGTVLSTMSMAGFADVEGITYVGGGQFLLTEERLQDVFRFSYTAGGTLTRSTLPSFSFGPTVGNIGLEGVSYDFVNNVVIGVKEKTDQTIYTANLDISTMTGTVTGFIPSLSLLDLSDVQVLTDVAGLSGSGHENNLLILSQESAKLLEVTRAGAVVSAFDLAGESTSIEGVTIGTDGTIYLVSEDPKLFVLTPVPEPSVYAAALCGGVLTATLCWRRRQIRTAA
jgi:uncharacterized protein YjiK